MAKRTTHRHLEFAVDGPDGQDTFRAWRDAIAFAVERAASTGTDVHVDVLAWTEGAARFWGGDAAVESYREDPEASVTERITIRANVVGRVA